VAFIVPTQALGLNLETYKLFFGDELTDVGCIIRYSRSLGNVCVHVRKTCFVPL
jgi:hypothetical protein